MLPLRHALFWQIAGMLLLLLVLLSTLLPVAWFWDSSLRPPSWLRHADKWFHGAVFLMLAIWFSGQYRRAAYWGIAVGLVAFGLFIEGCQSLVSYRSAELADLAADIAGITIGLAVAMTGLGGWSLRVENRYLAKRAGRRIE